MKSSIKNLLTGCLKATLVLFISCSFFACQDSSNDVKPKDQTAKTDPDNPRPPIE